MHGKFIVVEGLEGAGKSTAIHTLKNFLTPRVPELLITREPGGTRLGESVRHILKDPASQEPLDPRAELLLFYAARVQLLEHVIRPALAKGHWVLADRFELSTFAYQGGGRGLNGPMIQHLSSFCVGAVRPDLILFLDLPPKKGLQRARRRGKMDRIEQESLDFFTKVYEAYHHHIQSMDNVVIIDALQPLAKVQEDICTILTKCIPDR